MNVSIRSKSIIKALLITSALCLTACGTATTNTPEQAVSSPFVGEFVTELTSEGNSGTAVWTSDTNLVTAAHVIKNDKSTVSVKNSEGTMIEAKIDSLDLKTDVAKLSVSNYKNPTHAELYSGEPYKGPVKAAGYPYGGLSLLVTVGETDGKSRTSLMPGNISPSHDWVLYSAPTNPGMSGGGVFTEDGKLLGVISWRSDTKDGRPVEAMSYYTQIN